MKTAREIIAGAASETQRPAQFSQADWWSVRGKDFEAQADAILAALAAEGFSIVETGRDPVTIEACQNDGAWPAGCLKPNSCSRHKQCMYANCLNEGRDIAAEVEAALSRSTREGKTE